MRGIIEGKKYQGEPKKFARNGFYQSFLLKKERGNPEAAGVSKKSEGTSTIEHEGSNKSLATGGFGYLARLRDDLTQT